MKQQIINEIVTDMLPYLNNQQAEKLQTVLNNVLISYSVCALSKRSPLKISPQKQRNMV